MPTVRLTDDEIRTLTTVVDAYRMAQARATQAQEIEVEMVAKLRAKYKLDDSWQLLDLLTGFVRMGGDNGNNDN